MVYATLKVHRFVNRGVLNLPLCLFYGFVMDLLIVITSSGGILAVHFIGSFIIVSAAMIVSGFLAERFMRRPVWDYYELSVFSGHKRGFILSLLETILFFAVLKVIHPFIFMLVNMLPVLLIRILDVILVALLLVDFIMMCFSVRYLNPKVSNAVAEMDADKNTLGYRLAYTSWERLKKAYPKLEEGEGGLSRSDKVAEKSGTIFAKGLCLNKIIWVFLITSLFGDVIETFYCRLVGGTWMRRSGLVFGPFSCVWGIGAALMTVVLYRLSDKEDRYIFLGGFLFGGTFEYLCSVVFETIFGVKFWDYSEMPLNIDGRTNVLFMFFWGLLSLVWLKICYPKMSAIIEKIPPISGIVITWSLMFLMCCDLIVTGAVMYRASERHEKPIPSNVIARYADEYYPEEMMKELWPNLNFLS